MNTDSHGFGKGARRCMMRRLDKVWFRLLGVVHAWVQRRGQAHCRREKLRRLRRFLAWQKTHLN